MANNMIALQARAPQSDFLGGAIQRNAQMINMMRQQEAADRQASAAARTADIAMAKEQRDAAMAKPQMAEAEQKALSAQMKATSDFFGLTVDGLKLARSAEDAVKIGDFLKTQFSQQQFQQAVEQTLASLPQDPAAFEDWRQQTMFQSMQAKDQLDQDIKTQNTGRETWQTASPKYAGAPQGNGAKEIPGTRVQAAEDITYVKGPNGEVIPMPKTLPGTGGPVGSGDQRPGGGVAAALQTNPGALKDGAFARSQPGYAGASDGFATFTSPEAGVKAQENLLRGSYVNKGYNTIDKIVNRYAPQGSENSGASVSNYKKYIAKQTGIDVNQPITGAQVPAVAQAMREFETGQRPGGKSGANAGGGGGLQMGKPLEGTSETEVQRKAFGKILPIIGYDPKTGKDLVSSLISQSTSGGAEMLGSNAMALFGKATPGREALGQLRAIADNMTFEKLRGKLGAQISDADVRLIANTMADIANGNTPANERAAAWKNVVLPILLRGAGVEAPSGGNSNIPAGAIQKLRADPSLRGAFDAKYGAGTAAKILKGR